VVVYTFKNFESGYISVTSAVHVSYLRWYTSLDIIHTLVFKGGYTLVTLPLIVTPYRDSVDGTRDRVTCQKLATR